MKKNVFYFTFLIFTLLTAVSRLRPVIAQMAQEPSTMPKSGGWELFLHLAILVLAGSVLYSLWGSITTFGGLIGQALKIFGVGVLFFSIEAIHSVLEHFGFDFLENILSDSGNDIFHAVLTLGGLIFIAWGLTKITKIGKS